MAKGKKRGKFAGLKQHKIPKNRRSYVDYDYVEQLTDEEKKWLSKFSDEYYGSDFKINPTYIKENGEFVQISANRDKALNRDLRKCRNLTLYYKDDNGEFTTNKKFKYSKTNVHSANKYLKDCNSRANDMSVDAISTGYSVGFSNELNYILENLFKGSSPEDIINGRDMLIETIEKVKSGEMKLESDETLKGLEKTLIILLEDFF